MFLWYLSDTMIISCGQCFVCLFFYSVTIVCIFSPSLRPTPASSTSLPHLYPSCWFCPCVLYSSSYRPLSLLSPPHSPLAIVTLFLISMSLVSNIFIFPHSYCSLAGDKRWCWSDGLDEVRLAGIHAVKIEFQEVLIALLPVLDGAILVS